MTCTATLHGLPLTPHFHPLAENSVMTTTFSTREAHAHASAFPNTQGNSSCKSTEGAREKRGSMPNLLHRDWERQGKKNNGTFQRRRYCSCGSRQDLIWHGTWTRCNGSEDNTGRNQGGMYYCHLKISQSHILPRGC